jgi:hypothetical protein
MAHASTLGSRQVLQTPAVNRLWTARLVSTFGDILSPVAGAFIDRWKVKTTMIASNLICALLVIVLVFARDVNLMYARLFATCTVSAFFVPAQAVTVRTLSPPGDRYRRLCGHGVKVSLVRVQDKPAGCRSFAEFSGRAIRVMPLCPFDSTPPSLGRGQRCLRIQAPLSEIG